MATELEYEDIVRYKTSTDSKYRPGLSDNDKRNIREKAARYVLHHQLLYVVEVDKDLGTEKKRRVIVKEEEKKTKFANNVININFIIHSTFIITI